MKNINYAVNQKKKKKKKKHQITNQSKMFILRIKNKKARCLSTNLLDAICKEGKFTSWHAILPSSQNKANYKAPRIAARFCYHYSKTNRNLPSVMQKPNYTSARVSDDTSSPTRVSDDICNPARISDDTSEPIKLWHVSPIRLRHMSLTHPLNSYK